MVCQRSKSWWGNPWKQQPLLDTGNPRSRNVPRHEETNKLGLTELANKPTWIHQANNNDCYANITWLIETPLQSMRNLYSNVFLLNPKNYHMQEMNNGTSQIFRTSVSLPLSVSRFAVTWICTQQPSWGQNKKLCKIRICRQSWSPGNMPSAWRALETTCPSTLGPSRRSSAKSWSWAVKALKWCTLDIWDGEKTLL